MPACWEKAAWRTTCACTWPGQIMRHIVYTETQHIRYHRTSYRHSEVGSSLQIKHVSTSACPKVRVSVEWGFNKLISIFAFLDYKKNQKLYLQPVGKYYKVAALLINCHTCLYGSETTSYFGLQPPSLQEYLRHWLPLLHKHICKSGKCALFCRVKFVGNKHMIVHIYLAFYLILLHQ